jgi:hypothetical protein
MVQFRRYLKKLDLAAARQRVFNGGKRLKRGRRAA